LDAHQAAGVFPPEAAGRFVQHGGEDGGAAQVDQGELEQVEQTTREANSTRAPAAIRPMPRRIRDFLLQRLER